MNANKSETEYTADDVMNLLKAPRTICFISFCVLCILMSVCILRLVLRRLRHFETDVELYEQEQGLTGDQLILPAREKFREKANLQINEVNKQLLDEAVEEV